MDLLHILKSRILSGSLPGAEAHKRMAVPGRRLHPDASVSPKIAAVLMPLINRNEQWHLVFIRRNTVQGDSHSGQIGFPGGKFEPGDSSLIQTALREAHEEIGLPPDHVEIIGPLTPLYIPVSNFLVHPYLAKAIPPERYVLQLSEVTEVYEVPLQHFLQPAHCKRVDLPVGGGIVLEDVPCFEIQGQILWGATAMILCELLHMLPTEAPDSSAS